MLYLGINECLGNIKRTFIMVVLVSFLSIMCMILLGTYRLQSTRYSPFAELLEGKGLIGFVTVPTVNDYGGGDSFIAKFRDLEDVEYLMEYGLDVGGGKYVDFIGLSDRAASYVPALREGVWFTKAESKDGTIEAVASGPRTGYRTGDIIELKTEEGNIIRIHVCGVLDDETPVFGTRYFSKDYSLFDFYNIYNSSYSTMDDGLFMSRTEMENKGFGYYFGLTIVKFRDNISDDDYRANRQLLGTDGSIIYKTSEVREKTLNEIKKKVGTILPVTAGAFLLVSFGIAVLVAMDTKRQLGKYAIYFCCGMKWGQCILINLIESLICGAISFLVVGIIGNVLKIAGGKNLIMFSMGKEQLEVFGLIVFYMLLMSALIPAVIIKGNQPKDVLRKAEV